MDYDIHNHSVLYVLIVRNQPIAHALGSHDDDTAFSCTGTCIAVVFSAATDEEEDEEVFSTTVFLLNTLESKTFFPTLVALFVNFFPRFANC